MDIELIKKLNDQVCGIFKTLPDNYGFVIYVFDRSLNGYGTGFNRNTDKGDALVAIKRIAEQFHINLLTGDYVIYKNAWLSLAQYYGETEQKEQLELMDNILEGVKKENEPNVR